ncbi:hypothetical protein FI667_g1144, partial [Globisporangium splendens]
MLRPAPVKTESIAVLLNDESVLFSSGYLRRIFMPAESSATASTEQLSARRSGSSADGVGIASCTLAMELLAFGFQERSHTSQVSFIYVFPIATGAKKAVQVFECPTESWKQRAPRAQKHKTDDDESELPLKQQIKKEFDEAFDSVKDFASPFFSLPYSVGSPTFGIFAANASLKGKEKKAYEAKKIEALGGKAASNRHMPYHILMGIKKKASEREKRDKELNKQADVVSGKRKVSSSASSSKKKKKIDYGLQVTKGRFKNGVLTHVVCSGRADDEPPQTRCPYVADDIVRDSPFVHAACVVCFVMNMLLTAGFAVFARSLRFLRWLAHRWICCFTCRVAVDTRRTMHQLLSMNALHAAEHPNQERVQQSTFKQAEHPFDLFLCATSNGPEAMKGVPTSRTEGSEAIHLNRLLDDYMLGSKGDRIMKQMEEELTLDEQPIVTTSFESDLHMVQKSVDFPVDGKDQIDLDTNLDALLTMDDFTKYISEN